MSEQETAVRQCHRSFHVQDGLFFDKQSDGSVTVRKEATIEGIKIGLSVDIPANIWASLVLTMSEFNERPGDWQAFMAHHNGAKDMLVGQRGGY